MSARSLAFSDLYEAMKSLWPTGFYCASGYNHAENWEPIERLGPVEEAISERFIGSDDELIFRELSRSIKICVSDLAKKVDPVEMARIRTEYVRRVFESRLSMWKAENDGFTSDMSARDRYYEANPEARV